MNLLSHGITDHYRMISGYINGKFVVYRNGTHFLERTHIAQIKTIWQLMRPIKAKTESYRGHQYLFAGAHCGRVVCTIGDMVNTPQKIRLI